MNTVDLQRQRRAEEIFLEAVALSESTPENGTALRLRQSALVELRCAGDAALRAEVASLLGAHDQPAGLLDQPNLIAGTFGSIRAGRGLDDPALPPGTRVGGYTIQRVIGSGGMGIVYVAEQERPKRIVALKIIRPALASPAMLRRFDHEAEVLGRLHHPGIAHIFEAGVAPVERTEGTAVPGAPAQAPFLAMELVDGPSLIEFAERKNLNTAGRLELLARVCDAVQHAHQRGIIHRDLKPSNVLVDTDGQPKVLDFGVARVTDSDLQITTLRTSVGQLIGTLPYMSPEQVSGDQDEVDTRSDVYALGVVLYQLLTGRLPHDLSSRSIPEAARVIRDEHPSRLSSISRVFRGDVDNIVAKAIEKDKGRRYQSAAELAQDIRRHLAGEPIAAKRDSALYVLRKQIRRHRVEFAAAALLLTVLIAFSIYAAVQASANRRLARNLSVELSASNIERGRALGLAGSYGVAEAVIWREHLQHPDSLQAHWALWELYRLRPCLKSVRLEGVDPSLLAVAHDGSFIAVCGKDNLVRIWDGSLDRLIRTIDTQHGIIQCLAISPDGSLLLSGGADSSISLWDPRTGEATRTYPGLPGLPRSPAFSPDGRTLVVGMVGGHLQAWDVASGESLWTRHAHTDYVWSVVFSPDSSLLATCGREKSIRIWEPRGPKSLRAFRDLPGDVQCLQFSPDGRSILAAYGDGAIRVHDAESGDIAATMKMDSPGAHAFSLEFLPDGKTFVAGGTRSLELWDFPSRTIVRRMAEDEPGNFEVSTRSTDGALITTGTAGAVKVWDVGPDRAVRTVGSLDSGHLSNLTINRTGSTLATLDTDGTVRLFDTATNTPTHSFSADSQQGRGLAFSPDGSMLAVGLPGGRISVHRAPTWERSLLITGAGNSLVCSLAFSPDGSRLLGGTFAGDVKLFSPSTGECLFTVDSVQGRVYGVCFSPDGRDFAIAATNPCLRVFDSSTLQPVLSVPGAYNAWSVAFSPDGRTLAHATAYRVIDLYDTSTWKHRASLEGHTQALIDMTFSSDGSMIASAGADATIRLWDPVAGRHLATLQSGDKEISHLAFTKDSRGLYAGGSFGSLVLWDLPYYDRHIAGNLKAQMLREIPKMDPRPDTRKLEDWAASVLSEPASKP